MWHTGRRVDTPAVLQAGAVSFVEHRTVFGRHECRLSFFSRGSPRSEDRGSQQRQPQNTNSRGQESKEQKTKKPKTQDRAVYSFLREMFLALSHISRLSHALYPSPSCNPSGASLRPAKMMMIFRALLVLTLAAGGLAEESRALASGVWGAWKSQRVKVSLTPPKQLLLLTRNFATDRLTLLSIAYLPDSRPHPRLAPNGKQKSVTNGPPFDFCPAFSRGDGTHAWLKLKFEPILKCTEREVGRYCTSSCMYVCM